MARKSQTSQKQSRGESTARGSGSRSRSSSSSGLSARERDDLSQGSASARGRSSSSHRGGSSTNRGGSERGRNRSDSQDWQSQSGRDFEGGYNQASGQRGWEGDRQENFGRGYQDRDDRNRGASNWDDRSRGYQSQGPDYSSREREGGQFRSQERSYGDERSSGRGRPGGYREDENRFARADREWGPSGREGNYQRESSSWDEGRGYGGGERGYDRDRSYSSSGERSSGRDRGYGGESESSFRQREFAPERGRGDDFRSDDRFGRRYEEDSDYRGASRNEGGYQNEDNEERYYSGRGQRNQGGYEPRRGSSSSRSNETRWRE